MDISISKAQPADADTLLGLLRHHKLPTDGFIDHLETAVVARAAGRIIGTAAIEVYGTSALLRSVAVDPAFQGQHVGRTLTETALTLARSAGIENVYLLTTTAEAYFPKLGFSRVTREDVPDAVRQSVEFTSACPASATVMRKTFTG